MMATHNMSEDTRAFLELLREGIDRLQWENQRDGDGMGEECGAARAYSAVLALLRELESVA